MMVRAIAVHSSSRPAVLEAIDGVVPKSGGSRSSSSSRLFKQSFITCSSPPSPSSSSSSSSYVSRGHGYIPKLEPFSRTKFERALKDPPLIEKSENELAEYCSVLEGDEAYSCWRAYFELKELEKESAKVDVERLILQAGGVKSLIGCLHGIAEIHKAGKEATSKKMAVAKNTDRIFQHVPDGLPRSEEEIEEEERSRMPDSQFTRLLRVRGKHPAWYSPAPDHDTE